MNTINNISCQPLQPKQQTSFKGYEDLDKTLSLVEDVDSLDSFVNDPDKLEQASHMVVEFANSGKKGTKTLGTLAMIAGIGVGGGVMANKAVKRIFTSVGKNTKYLDGISDKAVNLFNKLSTNIQKNVKKVDTSELTDKKITAKAKAAFGNFVSDIPEKLTKFAEKGVDSDKLKIDFANQLKKSVNELTPEELVRFEDSLKTSKVKNAITKLASAIAGTTTATNAVIGAASDEDGNKIPDAFEQTTKKAIKAVAVGDVY